MIKLLHTADVHAGRQFFFLGDKAGDYRAGLVRTFEKIVDLAVKEEVSLLLIAGDLFDSNRVYGAAVGRVMAALHKLEKPGIRACLLPGIHDAPGEDSVYMSLQLPPNITLFTPWHDRQIYPDLDLTVYGLFPGLNPANGMPVSFVADGRTRFHAGLAHCALRSEGEPAGPEPSINAEEIAASGLDYLALGSRHSLEEVTSGNTVAYYSGSPEPLEPGCAGAGSVVLTVLSEGAPAVVRTVRVGNKRIENLDLDITGLPLPEEIVRAVEDRADPNLALQVVLTGKRRPGLVPDCREIEKSLGDRFFHLRVEDATRLDLSDLKSLEFPEKSVAGRFLKMAQEKIAAAQDEEERSIFEEALELGFLTLKARQNALPGSLREIEGRR